MPKTGAPVLVVETIGWATTANKHNGDDHEDNGGGEFKQRRPEFFLCISKSSENIDENDDGKKDLQLVSACSDISSKMATYADPDSHTGIWCPVLDDGTTNRQLERKNKSPLHDIIPTHGETPRGIHETVGIADGLLALSQGQRVR